jgi:zinc protease
MSFPILPLRTLKSSLAALSLFIILSLTISPCLAQSAPEPRREQLLNGLNVLLWWRPTDANVLLKLRIHSGAAFDLSGKAGTMALLGDTLFPNPATREYYTEELKGKLEVTTDYDAINITLSGPASQFESMVDLLHTALVANQPTAETVSQLREARAKIVKDISISPAAMADRAIATRLFGDYPYGRPAAGTPETLAKIERGDLLFARERFLNPNNATLAIIGGVDERRALRALRQLLGNWRKSETLIPATFRQPEVSDARTLLIDLPGAETTEVRLAARGLARSDRDYFVSLLLALLARDRWQAAMPELGKTAFFVRHEARALPGIFVMGAAVRSNEAARALTTARAVLKDLAQAQPPAVELERARTEALALFNRRAEQPESLADLWLERDGFKLASMTDQSRALSTVTPADIQRVAARLFKDTQTAAVAVGNAAQLKAELESAGGVELLGQPSEQKAQSANESKTAPSKDILLPAKRQTTTPPARKP